MKTNNLFLYYGNASNHLVGIHNFKDVDSLIYYCYLVRLFARNKLMKGSFIYVFKFAMIYLTLR